MDEVAKLLRSPVFWVCTGIGSIFFNVLSHYILRVMDKLANFVGGGSQRFMRGRRLRYLRRVRGLESWVRKDPKALPLLLHRSTTARLHGIVSLAIAAMMFGCLQFLINHPHSQSGAFSFFLSLGAVGSVLYLIMAVGYFGRALNMERLFRAFYRYPKLKGFF
jgi:hypothetical protein